MKVTPSTGNVFRDLGFSAEESEHLLVRADLLLQLQTTLCLEAGAVGWRDGDAETIISASSRAHP